MLGAFALFVMSTGIAFASASYTTTCGKVVMGPGQEFFETYGEWEDFVRDLNEVYCGTRDINGVWEKDVID